MGRVCGVSRGRSRGFSLIELMVSVVLFTILIVFGMSFFTMGNRPFVRARKIQFAATLGSEVLERFRTITYANIVSSTVTRVDVRTNTTYTCNVYVVNTTTGTVPYKIIGATVTWPQQPVAVTFATEISSTVFN